MTSDYITYESIGCFLGLGVRELEPRGGQIAVALCEQPKVEPLEVRQSRDHIRPVALVLLDLVAVERYADELLQRLQLVDLGQLFNMIAVEVERRQIR